MLLPTWERLAEDPHLAFAVNPDLEFPPSTETPAPTPGDVAEWIASAEPLLATYFNLEDPTRLEPNARELRIEVELDDGLPLRGIIDRVDVAPGTWSESLTTRLDERQVRVSNNAPFQMRFYALMLWRLNGTIPPGSNSSTSATHKCSALTRPKMSFSLSRRRCVPCGRRSPALQNQGDWQPKESRLLRLVRPP